MRLDRAALPGRVAAFEDDDDAQPLLLHPILQRAQLALQARQLLVDTSSASSACLQTSCCHRHRSRLCYGWLPAAAERPVELRAGPQLGPACLRQQQLLLEQLLIGGQDLDVAGEAGIVARTGQIGGILQRDDAQLPMDRAARPASES